LSSITFVLALCGVQFPPTPHNCIMAFSRTFACVATLLIVLAQLISAFVPSVSAVSCRVEGARTFALRADPKDTVPAKAEGLGEKIAHTVEDAVHG
jgi:hypothetical protein